MLASMTGFGEASVADESLAVAVEVRTINNRHLKLSLRASEGYSIFEPEIDGLVRKHVRRGAVQLNLRVSRITGADAYQIDAEVLEGYRRQLQEVAGEAPPVAALLSLPGVVAERQATSSAPREDWPRIVPAIEQALAALAEMRGLEGQALENDLRENCGVIAEHLERVEQQAPKVSESYRDRLVERVNSAMGQLGVSVEPADLVREVAVFADRTDISEETVRLRSHIDQFLAAMDLPESNGRKLEFITQEMVREVNTIGSKANDAEITACVVEMKTALERIREQVQNVE
ncbi:MAG: YicC/YloC family endoribonuclease [Planctomycetota bacterium]